MSHPGSALRWIVGTALRFRVLVVAAAAAVMVAGVLSAPKMQLDVLPEFAPPQVEIQTEALGLSAGEVEQLITVPLEADLLNGVAWLEEIRSESIAGLSSIELVFEPGTDILEARQVVAERLTQAHALPNVSRPPAMLQPLSSTSRVMMVGLSSSELSLMDMSVLARWQIRPYLMGVPGVANVSIWGQREQQLQVRVDPERLRDNGVSLAQVVESTGNSLWVSPLSFVEASTPGTGGFIDTPQQRLPVQHISPITTAGALSAVTIEDTEGRTLRLGDVADVVEDHQPLIGDAVVNDAPGLMLVIEKFPGVSTPEVTDGIESALEDLAPGLPGVEMDTSVYQPATFIDSALDNLALVGLIGLLLLLLLLGIYLLDWRAAFISLIAVALSLAAAVLVLVLLDATANLLVLAGLVLALGVIIDDSLVDVERIRRRLQQRGADDKADAGSAVAAVLRGSLETRSAIFVATLIVLAAAVPVLLLPGLTGEFTSPLLWAYALAVLTSTVVALAVTPVLGLLLLSKPRNRRDPRVFLSLSRRYSGALSRFVGNSRRAFAAVAIAGLAAVAALAILPQVGDRALMPALREPVLLIQWDGAPGMSEPEMTRLAALASEELSDLPGVSDVGGHVGRAITSDQVVGVDSGELWVRVEPEVDYDATVAAVREVVDGYPGVSGVVGTYTDERLQDADSGTQDQLVVRVYGQELETLQTKAAELTTVLAEVDGVVAPRVVAEPMEPTVEVEVDLAAAEVHGIKPGDVRRAAATLLSGVEVGSLFEEQKVFEVVVWGTPEIRHSMSSVEDLLIDVPRGGQVRLGDVADVRMTPNSSVIQREAVSRRVDVVADLDDRSLDDVVSDVEQAIATVEFPLEYHAEVLDGSVAGYTSDRDTLGLSIAALVLILLLLQASLGSWRLGGLIVLTLPVALLGGVLVAFAYGGDVTLVGLAALLTIFGVAVRNVLVLAGEVRQAIRERGLTGPEAVLEAAAERVLPVLATAAAIALVVLPVAVLGGATGLEILRPAALVILGGLVTSTLYALFVLPALYLRIPPEVAVETGDQSDLSPTPRIVRDGDGALLKG